MLNKAKKKVWAILAIFLCIGVWLCVDKVLLNGKNNKTVSLFSWNYEFMDADTFLHDAKMLDELGITRVYQLIPVEWFGQTGVQEMVKNLHNAGIETVLLTGDKSWITDGLDEYRQLMDSLSSYNESVPEELQIKKVALDVEVHALAGWEESSEEMFGDYVDCMEKAKQYANQNGVEVIQIVPTYYDDVNEEKFLYFLESCCDELSVMNYNKNVAFSAISNEVELCSAHQIPIETIFETMEVDNEHMVTKDITYHYDGLNVLKKDVKKMKNTYGTSLGVAFHHYSSLVEMYNKENMDK